MEAHVASVLNGIVRSTAPSGLRKALSFRVVELALRDHDAVRSYPPARLQQWRLQQCLLPDLVEQLVEVLKGCASIFGEVSRRDPAADCRAGCRSAQDLVPRVKRPPEADF